jgi:hypothetical protein
MESVTSQQRMLTLPRYMILHLVFPGVRVNLIFTEDYSMYLIWALILTADFFRLSDWTHWFWLRIVLFTWSGHTDFDYWYLSLKWGSRRMWPVGRGWLLFPGIRSYFASVVVRVALHSILYLLFGLWLRLTHSKFRYLYSNSLGYIDRHMLL